MKLVLFPFLILPFFTFASAEASPNACKISRNFILQDTIKKSNFSFPIFKLGFGQTRIPVSEMFLTDPKIEMNDFSGQKFRIKQYTLILLFSNGNYETTTNEGGKFTNGTIVMLKKAKPGDKLIVDDIEAYNSKSEVVNIPSRSIYLR